MKIFQSARKGDLAGVYVYKLKMVKQLTLLAYEYCSDGTIIMLMAFGSHENFYKQLKRS